MSIPCAKSRIRLGMTVTKNLAVNAGSNVTKSDSTDTE